MDQAEFEKLAALDAQFLNPKVKAEVDRIVDRVEAVLAADPESDMAWEPIPLEIYSDELPGDIQSSWVFVLRADTETGAERHPNSRQRMMAYRGDGDFQTRLEGPWQSNWLVSDPDAPLESRWISIPPYVWHQSARPEIDWVVVSFHTVAAEELIEERPGESDTADVKQMKYI